MTHFVRLLRRVLRGFVEMARLLWQGWRLWLLGALLGALLLAGRALTQPPQWRSEGQLVLRPRILREGHWLSLADLGANYALRLREEQRVVRISQLLGLPSPVEQLNAQVTTWHEPAIGLLHLQVVHPDPALAEALARALLLDFARELEQENRTRPEADRLVLEPSRSSFAQPVTVPWPLAALQGASIGAALGVLLVLLSAWQRRGRVLSPLEAEQLTGAPSLGAIPRARFKPLFWIERKT